MCRVLIKRDGTNPLSHKAQYRVFASCQDEELDLADHLKDKKVIYSRRLKILILATQRLYQPNTFINPRKAAGI
jgi:hypothetical protein